MARAPAPTSRSRRQETFVYTSNRGHDSIVIYRIDPLAGTLSYVGHESTQGKTPRSFGIDPSGRFLLAANQDSDSIVTFRIDPDSGKLQPNRPRRERADAGVREILRCRKPRPARHRPRT